MRHKWIGKAIGESSGYRGGTVAVCEKCGCVKEIIGGRITYFIRDYLYDKAPKCKGLLSQIDNIMWESVSVGVNHIWLKTKPISDYEHSVLERIFKNLLHPKFRINKDEIGSYYNNIFSITIFINCIHPFWVNTNCPNLQKYADDPFLLFINVN